MFMLYLFKKFLKFYVSQTKKVVSISAPDCYNFLLRTRFADLSSELEPLHGPQW